MKIFYKALLLCLSLTTGIWGQEAKKPAYRQGIIGIHSRFGAASVYSSIIGQGYTIPINTILFELIPSKRDKRGSAFLLSFRIMQPFTATPASLNRNYYRPMYHMLTWGVLIGGSTELYVQNKATGMGWNVLLNGGIFTDIFNVINPTPLEFADFKLGAEIDLKAVYRFGQYSAFSMGINLGYTWRISNENTGDHAFVYGFNIGFIF